MFNSRRDFADCLLGLIEPLKKYYTKGCGGLKLGHTEAVYPDSTARMEAFARILWGLAPLWSSGESAGEFDEIYRRGIASGTDPESDEYWGDIPAESGDQLIVEMAALGLALILAPERVWDPLSEREKANFHKWLMQVNCKILNHNNWQLFPVLVNLGFKNVGAPYDRERLREAVEICHSFYRTDGWYRDGHTEQSDYYIAFALHFYSLIYAKVMEDEDPVNSKIFKDRAAEFAKSFVYWIDEDGSALAFGRSLTYRFAQCSFFSACVWAGVKPFPLGVMKGIISRHLEWWMSKPILDNGGILSVGYAYPNLNMAENYNAYGSPYWAFKFFLFLALDEDDEFFSAEPLPLPELEKMKTIPSAYMTMQRINGYVVALTGGQYATWGMTHAPEKYSKFAYSTRYAFSVSRSMDSMYNASPDSTLAFDIDGRIFYRTRLDEYSMTEDGTHYSRWSPCRGISVETTLIPTDVGHIRRHRVECDFDCIAYDTAFSTPPGGGGEIHGEGGVELTLACEPNSNLIYPKTEMKAVKYSFTKGVNEVETVVIYP
ncbi:MAG: DUF2264 domain-containing protein [Clostridia bacterium]|nr:DUF2264 domain-containing protein [Clostridia bacterium]